MQMRSEFIACIPNWNKLFGENFSSFFLLLFFSLFFFWLVCLLLLALFFHSWSSGAFSPVTQPRGRAWCLSCGERTRFSGVPQQWRPLTLAQILPEEKRHSPERVLETTQGSSRYFPFQVDRKHRQEFRQSSFPFPRGRSPVPPQSTSAFPLPEKNLKTHGVLAG